MARGPRHPACARLSGTLHEHFFHLAAPQECVEVEQAARAAAQDQEETAEVATKIVAQARQKLIHDKAKRAGFTFPPGCRHYQGTVAQCPCCDSYAAGYLRFRDATPNGLGTGLKVPLALEGSSAGTPIGFKATAEKAKRSAQQVP